MSSYEKRIGRELERWERKLLKGPGLIEKNSKQLQTKINAYIPQQVHNGITLAIKGMFNAVLFGLDFIPQDPPVADFSLEDRDRMAGALLSRYQKIAAAEGAGTGAGGFVASLADFPALVAIKLKFLFELAHIYGFSTQQYSERLYLLYIFQLAFSSQAKRGETLKIIKAWNSSPPQINWEDLQKEYRDTIDFRKMLQMLPGIGAVVGAWANHSLMEDLGVAGINSFRLRILQRRKEDDSD